MELAEGVFEKVADAYLHDARRLPHAIAGNLDDLFPRALAAPALEEEEEPQDPLELRGHAIGTRDKKDNSKNSACWFLEHTSV